MGLFNHRREPNPDERRDTDFAGNREPAGASNDLQSRMRVVSAFPRTLEAIADLHPRDGYPDSPLAALGSRYQLVQMLSLRDPMDARYLNDSHATPYWLRTTANLPGSIGGTGETQRMGHSPQPALSPYQVEDWRSQYYRDTPRIGKGPGSVFVIPISQVTD